MQVTSCREYVPHCEQFELKLDMRGEEGSFMNFPKCHGDRATSTMFLQFCHKIYWTDLVSTLLVYIVRDLWAKDHSTVLEQELPFSYCSDLAPSDFFLF